MKRLPVLAWLAATAALLVSPQASAQQRATYEKMVAVHAKANKVPEALVHRVIVRESKYRPELIGHGGTIGLMQIKLATARGVGYTGDAEGLRDPDTNLTYGVKYLAGAWRAAEGSHDRAVQLYAAGYYHVAKQQRLARLKHPEPELAEATAQGRIAEFARMGRDPAVVPDPQDPETFRRSHLDWSELAAPEHARLFAIYRELIALRRREPELTTPDFGMLSADWDDAAGWFELRQGQVEVLVNLGTEPRLSPSSAALLFATCSGVTAGSEGVELPPDAAAVVRRRNRSHS